MKKILSLMVLLIGIFVLTGCEVELDNVNVDKREMKEEVKASANTDNVAGAKVSSHRSVNKEEKVIKKYYDTMFHNEDLGDIQEFAQDYLHTEHQKTMIEIANRMNQEDRDRNDKAKIKETIQFEKNGIEVHSYLVEVTGKDGATKEVIHNFIEEEGAFKMLFPIQERNKDLFNEIRQLFKSNQ